MIASIAVAAVLASRARAAPINCTARTARVRAHVDGDEQAIRALGFAPKAFALEHFQRLPKDVQKRLVRETVSVLIDFVIAGLDQGMVQAGSLNPWGAQKIIGYLKKRGWNYRIIVEPIRAVAFARDKSARLRPVRELLQLAARDKDVIEHDDPEDVEQFADGVAAILGWALEKHPEVTLRFALYKWMTARALDALTGVVAVTEVEGLTRLTEGDLARLRDLDNRLKRDESAFQSAWHRCAARLPKTAPLEAHAVSPQLDVHAVSPQPDVHAVAPTRPAHAVAPAPDGHAVSPTVGTISSTPVAPAPPAPPPDPPACHDETTYETVRSLEQVGFDEHGNPKHEMRERSVPRTRRVCP